MLKIGCCGYPIGAERYQETFRIVELNSTFYKYPQPQTVKKWREKAPKYFEFTVKAHQDITHKFKMRYDKTLNMLNCMKEICCLLDAKVLLFQTPASVKPDKLKEIEKFFGQVNRENLFLVWETRGPLWETFEAREKLAAVLERCDVSHVTDPFKSMPAYVGKVAYLRLHGHGERTYQYQYSDTELEKLFMKTKILGKSNRDVYVFFNNLAMFEDARRFLFFADTRCFPKPKINGKEALKAMLSKVKYPATKKVLIEKIGWKIIELEDGKQVRLTELLNSLSRSSYASSEAVTKEILI